MIGTLSTVRCACGLRLWRLTVGRFTFTYCGQCDRAED